MPKPAVTDGVRLNSFNGLGSHAPIIKKISASATLTAADSGTIYHVTGATAAVTVTLPAISTGPFSFLIINGSDVDLTVAAGTADTAVTFNDLAADSVAFSTSSEKIGGAVEVYCDGVTLFVLGRICSSYQNVTIAS